MQTLTLLYDSCRIYQNTTLFLPVYPRISSTDAYGVYIQRFRITTDVEIPRDQRSVDRQAQYTKLVTKLTKELCSFMIEVIHMKHSISLKR